MIDLSFLRNHPVAVLGLGRTGLTAATALYESGVQVWAWDDTPQQVTAARERGIDIVDLTTADLAGIEYLVLSPGIPHTHPEPHPVVTRAKAAGLKIVSDIDLLFQADPHARYICVTGTNGKSTTTALIGHILQTCGVPCQVGGNLGQGVLGFAPMGKDGVYVIEMSSYQLELSPSLTPDVAILLNITPDHLARHGGMEGYVAAKRAIFRKGNRQQTAIICIDDEYSRAIARDLAAQHSFAMTTISVTGQQASIMVDNALLTAISSGTVADLDDMKTMRGAHNWQNMAAAFAAARGVGVSPSDVLRAMQSFPGLVHRQQLVAEIGGVAYINDSKATNADAAAKALSTYRNIYWILGGQAVEGGLRGLESLMNRVRHAFLIGEAQDDFAIWLEGRVAFTKCDTLENAVRASHGMATSGSIVLLSPACKSWDQFTSFEQRGDRFIELVRALERESVQ